MLAEKTQAITAAILPQLNRSNVFFPLVKTTQAHFENANFRLWAGEAVMIAKLLTPRLPKNAKVLDMAAGHGIFGCTLAQKHPTARIVALDWKPVLQVAAENAKKFAKPQSTEGVLDGR